MESQDLGPGERKKALRELLNQNQRDMLETHKNNIKNLKEDFRKTLTAEQKEALKKRRKRTKMRREALSKRRDSIKIKSRQRENHY